MRATHLKKIVKTLVFTTVIATPLIYFRPGVYPFTLGKTLLFQILVELLFFPWLGLAILDKRYRPHITPLTVAGGVFLAALIATSVFGVDPWRSFWSVQERSLGVVTIIHMAAFALIVSSLWKELPMKKLLFASVGSAVLVGAIGILQPYIPNLLIYAPTDDRPGSTFGNPSFVGGYLLLSLLLIIYLVLDAFKGRAQSVDVRSSVSAAKISFFAFAFFVLVYALFLTETRGTIIALTVSILVFFALFVAAPPQTRLPILNKRSFYAGILACFIVIVASFWFTRTHPMWDSIPGLSRFETLSLSDPGLQPRITALRAAWKSFLDYPVMGLGWENFNVGFNKYYDPKTLEVNYAETRFDKPHNFALEVLSVGGMVLALAYLILYGVFLFVAWRIGARLFAQCATALLTGYVLHNLFLFETIGPMLVLFLMIGVADGAYRARREAASPVAEPAGSELSPLRSRIALGTVCAAIIPIYFLNIPSLTASYYQGLGFKSFTAGAHAQVVKYFKKAINFRNPYFANIKRDYATLVAGAYFYNTDAVSQEEALEAVGAMEDVVAKHPHDAYYHYTLVDLYNQIYDINPEVLLEAAEAEAAKALELSPNRQQVLFSLSKTKYLQGKREEAVKMAKTAIDLNPRVADGYFYYGLLTFANSEPELGYEAIKKALEMGREWKDYNEPRVIANYFADYGKLPEAIRLYEKALELYSGDLEAKVKLAVAYYMTGEKEKAKFYFEQALEKGEFVAGPAYDAVFPALKELGLVK